MCRSPDRFVPDTVDDANATASKQRITLIYRQPLCINLRRKHHGIYQLRLGAKENIFSKNSITFFLPTNRNGHPRVVVSDCAHPQWRAPPTGVVVVVTFANCHSPPEAKLSAACLVWCITHLLLLLVAHACRLLFLCNSFRPRHHNFYNTPSPTPNSCAKHETDLSIITIAEPAPSCVLCPTNSLRRELPTALPSFLSTSDIYSGVFFTRNTPRATASYSI